MARQSGRGGRGGHEDKKKKKPKKDKLAVQDNVQFRHHAVTIEPALATPPPPPEPPPAE